jgi:DNA-binding response OmpR family regulator
MRKKSLLLFDRAPEFGAMVAAALRSEFALDVVAALPGALAAARRPQHDAFLVDVTGAADDAGIEFLRALRQGADTRPAIAMSGNLDRELPARCYEAGATGFVPKTRTLLRELRGLLPRILPAGGGALRTSQLRVDGITLPQRTFTFAGATVDPVEMSARFGTRRVELNPKEVGILHLLAQRRGGLVRRSEILAHVWGPDAVPTSKSLDTYLTRLRRAFAQAGVDFRAHVVAKPKVGWRIVEGRA